MFIAVDTPVASSPSADTMNSARNARLLRVSKISEKMRRSVIWRLAGGGFRFLMRLCVLIAPIIIAVTINADPIIP